MGVGNKEAKWKDTAVNPSKAGPKGCEVSLFCEVCHHIPSTIGNGVWNVVHGLQPWCCALSWSTALTELCIQP